MILRYAKLTQGGDGGPDRAFPWSTQCRIRTRGGGAVRRRRPRNEHVCAARGRGRYLRRRRRRGEGATAGATWRNGPRGWFRPERNRSFSSQLQGDLGRRGAVRPAGSRVSRVCPPGHDRDGGSVARDERKTAGGNRRIVRARSSA